MIVRERLDRTTVRELLRLAEEHERRAVAAGKKEDAARWYSTCEWLRDLEGLTR